MSIFHRRQPAHVPPAGPITLTRQQFHAVMRSRPSGAEYLRTVGAQLGPTALDNAFTESLRKLDAQGFWRYAGPTTGNGVQLRFTDQATLTQFIEIVMDTFFTFDLRKMRDRATYCQQLRQRALDGDLHRDLAANTEPEANYFRPTPPVVSANAPPLPAKSPDHINLGKAMSWATAGLRGDKTPYSQCLMRHKRFDGTLPFGPNTQMVDEAFPTLVPGAPAYRGWNDVASQQRYPSNIGGKKVLGDLLLELSQREMPDRGDVLWYGYALFLLGSIITLQPFTDGNKRMARFVYSLTLLSGGVPFLAPTDRYGSQLGAMM